MRYELTDSEWAAIRILKRANRVMGCTRGTARRLARLERRTPHAERACPAEYRRFAYRKSPRVLPSRHAIVARSDPHRPSSWGSPPVAPEPGVCRSDHAPRSLRSDAARLKFLFEPVLGQPPSDEHETAVALFIRFPRTLGTAFEKHVHALAHEALVVVLHRDDALHSKDVCSEILRDLLNPGNKAFGIERAVGGQRQAADLVIVFMFVGFDQKIRENLENA